MLRISGNKIFLDNIGIKCGVVCNSDGHKGRPGATGRFDLACNHGALEVPLDDIGLDDVVMEAGGLERRIRAFRLPNENRCREMNETVKLDLHPSGDNPIWVSVFTEDGFQAWSSPIFVFQGP